MYCSKIEYSFVYLIHDMPMGYHIEMGRSSADAEVRPNVRLGNVRLFGRTSANIRRHWGFELAAFCARRWR